MGGREGAGGRDFLQAIGGNGMNRMGRGLTLGGDQWENGMARVGGASGTRLGWDEPDGVGFGGGRSQSEDGKGRVGGTSCRLLGGGTG